MTILSADRNPRGLRDEYKAFVGKKVMIGLRSYHYVSCRVTGLDPLYLDITVAGKAMKIPVDQIDNIAEAPEAQAEYVK